MTDRLLYNLAIPDQTFLSQSQQQVRQLLAQGTLAAGPGAVEDISGDPQTQTLAGRVVGRHAELTAEEFEELFDNDSIRAVPYFERGPQTSREDRYVALEDVTVNPAHPTDTRVQSFDGNLRTRGTRRSHWRTVETAVTTESNPFGSASTEEIAIPALADVTAPVRWYNRDDGSLDDATVQATRAGEHDDLVVYDATEPSFGSPTLVYSVAYRHEWPVDCRVWDDYGRDKYDQETADDGDTVGSATVGSATVGTGVDTEAVQWQRVYASKHDYRGRPVLENDILRLIPDEDAGTLRVWEWNDADEHYDRVQLGTSSWRLLDWNTRRIGVERIDGQAEFEDQSNPGSTHNLNFSLKRGCQTVCWYNPANEGAVPSGLTGRLSPIANTSEQDPGAVADLIEGSEVDR